MIKYKRNYLPDSAFWKPLSQTKRYNRSADYPDVVCGFLRKIRIDWGRHFMTLERKLVRNTFFRFLWPTMASALMLSVQDSDRVYLRIRDNLTEWTPQGLDQPYGSFLRALEQDSGVNEAGFNIIWKISKEHSYKRTIGYNNFAVIL